MLPAGLPRPVPEATEQRSALRYDTRIPRHRPTSRARARYLADESSSALHFPAMDPADDLREQLATLGARRTKARHTLTEVMEEIEQVAPRALAAGIGKSEIARLTAISRPALDAALNK